LVDTSVIIALFRKNEDAKKVLDSLNQEDVYICDITIMEILAGCFTVKRF
jgi:predicted nucleic acid-binding protein